MRPCQVDGGNAAMAISSSFLEEVEVAMREKNRRAALYPISGS
jgi:hypothetical protein